MPPPAERRSGEPHSVPGRLGRETTLLRESFVEAVRTLGGNPLRSGLAVVALAFAVATSAVVSAALAAVERDARQATERLLGSDSFVLARAVTEGLGRREAARKLESNPPIAPLDLRFLERHADDEVIYSAVVQTLADVSAGGRTFERAAINGVGASLPEIRNLPIADGRFFLPVEDQRASQVVVLGADVADELFPEGAPVSADVRIQLRGFRVVGVLARQGSSGGVSLDRYVYLPLRAYERVFGRPESLRVLATAPASARARTAEDRARVSMRARRQLRPGEPDNFDIQTPDAARSFVETLTASVSTAAPPITGMALLAAVIVVTNTILVSIAQRTREIGVRRAVGAKRVHITLEVLAESTLIALLGGAFGLAGAVSSLSLLGLALGTSLPLAPGAALASFGAAAGAGVLAGLYPARRAASIEVTRALQE